MRTPACLFLLFLCAGLASALERPNIVFFLVDDMGWADVGVNGSTFHHTPHIDALAASGMNFTHGYAACPVCSPTRASIMTGRHPVRVDITDWIPGRTAPKDSKFEHVADRNNLAHAEITLAEALKGAGYKTFFAGKWHLGEEGHWPEDQGFDVNIGGHHRGSPPGGYYAPWKNPALEAKKDGEYLTERLTEETVSFMEKQGGKEPFLVYLSYYNIHTPIQAYKKWVDFYQERASKRKFGETPTAKERDAFSRMAQDNIELASMVSAVDDSVGAVLASVEKLGLSDNTVVVFTSDNGGLCTLPARRGRKGGPGCNLPLRSGKGWLYEGGVREPFIFRVPGVTKAGSTSAIPVVSTDFFPTLLDLAKVPAPEVPLDGVSLVSLLKGGTIADRALYWHYPHYHGSDWKPGASIRDGDWKLIEFYEYGESELYNLAEDQEEKNNLIEKHAERAAALKKKLAAWQEELGAKMPVLRK